MTSIQKEKVSINVSFDEENRLIGIDEQNTSSTVSSSIIDKFMGLVTYIAGGTNTNDIKGSCEDHMFSGDIKRMKNAMRRIVLDILPNYRNSNVGYPEFITKYVNDLSAQIELFDKKGKTILEEKCNIKF